MKEQKQQYNTLLKRVSNAEEILNNIDKLRAEGKAPESNDYYINAYRKLIGMLNNKAHEIEKSLGRKLTKDERHKGFKS